MNQPTPVVLEGHGVRLEPLSTEHEEDLRRAAADGKLWELWYTSIPAPAETGEYIRTALEARSTGHMLPWAVRELSSGEIVGSTRYHDIVLPAHRLEIGATWYARRWQRTHVNTACKLLLLTHAFETLSCGVVGLRTDALNLSSQAAIERLGARKEGVIRQHQVRRDGSVRDTVMYSILLEEWPEIRERLVHRLEQSLTRRTRRRETAPLTECSALPVEGFVTVPTVEQAFRSQLLVVSIQTFESPEGGGNGS